MTWTKQPPKERGYYWFRQPGKFALAATYTLLVVRGPDEHDWWHNIGPDVMGHSSLFSEAGEWWDQRITEPPA